MKIFFNTILTFLLSFSLSAQTLDINILRDIHTHRNQGLDPTFKTLSKATYPISAAVPIGIFGIGLIKRNKDLQRQGLAAGAGLVVSLGTSYILKKVIDRPRPAEKYPFIHPYIIETDSSFPSGHTTAAFSTATSLSLMARKWYVIVPAYLWAGTVAYSRLYLGVHYPSDVLAGALIGAGSAWASYKVNRWLQKKRKY
ncbi:phosphatase PAP2 family protein [Emticicia sp. BO119]|uniref:phosphatase PAP2 family protein n=1 Tax=Emticicia sp. BO119 TaxID=2757768 RepID=UPI0015F0615E|nr:phosphatase PAP2 family protein [Emticicia sp. BO119]MBA4853200.1 phosphatase PAP2 family protein [Emticicia sp. BO119]